MAWRVGLFALAGLVLLSLAIALVGGRWFAEREQAVMRFDGSVYGLQVGAPVVLRGVRVGQVSSIGFAPAAGGGLAVPVSAEFDRALLVELVEAAGGQAGGHPVAALVAQGLMARLAMQSLLTGQLYVDLDFDTSRVTEMRAGPAPGAVAMPAGPATIPTAPTRLQTLQTQLEGLDLAQIGSDVAAVAASMKQLLAGPEPSRALARTADAAASLERLALRLEAGVGPLARSAEAALAESQRAMQQLGQGAQQLGQGALQIGQGAQQVATAASQVQALAAGGVPMVAEVQRTAVELARAAAALREAAAEDSVLRLNADRALQDVSRAARSLRELGEMLERQPDALLRGRATSP